MYQSIAIAHQCGYEATKRCEHEDFEHQYWRCRRYAYVEAKGDYAKLCCNPVGRVRGHKAWEYGHLVEVSDFDEHDDEDRCGKRCTEDSRKEGCHAGHGRYSEVLRVESRLSTYVVAYASTYLKCCTLLTC